MILDYVLVACVTVQWHVSLCSKADSSHVSEEPAASKFRICLSKSQKL